MTQADYDKAERAYKRRRAQMDDRVQKAWMASFMDDASDAKHAKWKALRAERLALYGDAC